MRWLVTGADGFVGQALAARLLAQDQELVLVVRRTTGPSQALRDAHGPSRLTVASCSLGDPNRLAELADGCDVAVHAAAVHREGSAPRAYRWVNVAGQRMSSTPVCGEASGDLSTCLAVM